MVVTFMKKLDRKVAKRSAMNMVLISIHGSEEWAEDNDYDRRGSQSNRGGRSSYGASRGTSSSGNGSSSRRSEGRSSSGSRSRSGSSQRSSGKRGFGSMPREEVRR